jgi:hypothetical protein
MHCGDKKYLNPKPLQQEIDLVNKKYKDGHTIILHTGRGWDQYEITIMQLKKFGIKYHQLVCGKPIGIYVDKDSITSLRELD